MRANYIFCQIFSYDITFYQSHGHLKNHPCFLKQDKNYVRIEIRSTTFLAIAIAITALTLFKVGFFGAARGWGGLFGRPSLKSVTYILQ